MFEQTFKNIDDVLWKEAGCATELDYTEQTSWILFLKYLDDLERANEQKAELQGKKYTYIIDKAHRWSFWAAPKKKDGSFDHDKAKGGPDLIEYVDDELFPYLKGFRTRAEGANTIEYKIGEIFSEIENKFRSGYSLRDALELVDGLSFRSQEQKHELSHLYEAKLRNMGNAGRNGGEYYTPRPLIRAMIQVVKPQIGERIYDGACGSAGFLCEAFDYLTRDRERLSTKDLNTLQTRTFYAKEKKSLAYVIGIMNMILHGIEAPNIVHTNTLTENISDIQDKDRFDVVLANPPFGGKERPEVQQNFPIKTGETAFLFLQHFIKSLKAGGRAAIVIKNTFLSGGDNASVALRKELLENCNLHTVLDMPGGTFQGAGVKTVVLFFEKGSATRNVWFYKLDPGRNLGKTNPLNDDDLRDFVALQAKFEDSENSWTVDGRGIDKTTYDLSVTRAELIDPLLRSAGWGEDALARIKPDEIRRQGRVPKNASVFFTIFQTFMSGTGPDGQPAPYFGDYPPDFFDFIIIDECHRGGANDESNWRDILDYFSPAVQLGLTATPKRRDNVDTYKYFGDPVYTYSLKDGINDGFLTPFKVKQIATTLDDYLYAPDDKIVEGEVEEGKRYREPQFNRTIEIEERERYRVKLFMDQIDQREKTLVFCATRDGEPMEPEEAKPRHDGMEDEGTTFDGEMPAERPQKIKIRLADGKERSIQSMMATTFWSPDGKPISANQFVEKLFGELPQFFKDEEELRKLWSRPDTRKALLHGLAEKGFAGEQLTEISRMINAEKSDLFDVLAYIAFALAPITRSERVETRKKVILARYDAKLQSFLDFVLAQYVNQGVGELDQDKLGNLLELKYHTVSDAAEQLGGVPIIRDTFVGFQQYLYDQ